MAARIDGRGPKDAVTHDEVAQAIVVLEGELQELGVEVVRLYSYRLYSDINDTSVNDHYSIRLKFKVSLFGQERLIMTKYPHKKGWLWRDMQNRDYATTLDYYLAVKRQMLI